VRVLAERRGVEPGVLQPPLYFHEHDAAVMLRFRVTSGLDAMVVVEPQITGKFKRAYHASVDAGTIGTVLHRALHESFRVSKRVRAETGIGEHAVSLSFLAVELAKQIFGALTDKRALLIGAGEMSTLAARHLHDNGLAALDIANRSLPRAQTLASELDGHAHTLDALPELLKRTDIVISSTNAPEPLLTRRQMAKIMRARRGRPLFLVDLAVPRDIAPDVHRIENVYLYDVDDMKQVLAQNLAARQREAHVAEQLVQGEVHAFMRRLDQLEVVPTIVALREHCHDLAERELARLLQRQSDLTPAQTQAIQGMMRGLVNKLLHKPVVTLKRSAGQPDQAHMIEATRMLFDLPDTPQELPTKSDARTFLKKPIKAH